jgi:malate dehydrogenase
MPKIGLIGFGEIGIELAKVLIQDPVTTYDIVAFDRKEAIEKVPGMLKGNYEDILDGIGVSGRGHTLSMTHEIGDLAGSDAIIFSAGLPRGADQTRADLIGANIPIVGGICEKLKSVCPDTFLIMVANPLDAMVELAYRKLGASPSRIVGQAGVLDTGRFTIQASLATGQPCSKISTIVLGGHGPSMVPVYSHALVGYKALKDTLPEDKVEAVTKSVRGRGKFIITQKGHSSSFPTALAAVKMLKAYLGDTKEIMACCTRLQGEYGHKDVFAGVPTQISAKGVKPVEIALAADEKTALDASISGVREIVAELDELTK